MPHAAELDRLEPERWKKPLELIRQTSKRAVGAVKRPEACPSDQQLAASFEEIVQVCNWHMLGGRGKNCLSQVEHFRIFCRRSLLWETSMSATVYKVQAFQPLQLRQGGKGGGGGG